MVSNDREGPWIMQCSVKVAIEEGNYLFVHSGMFRLDDHETLPQNIVDGIELTRQIMEPKVAAYTNAH